VIHRNALLRTRAGLLTASSLAQSSGKTSAVWSGRAWESAAVEAAGEADLAEIRLEDGCTLTASADAEVLVAGVETYGWKMVGELTDEDRLCAGADEGDRIGPTGRRYMSYWLGYLFGDGVELPDHQGVLCVLDFGSKEENVLVSKEAMKWGRQRRLMIHENVIEDGKVTLRFVGKPFVAKTQEYGVTLDESGNMFDVPPGCLMSKSTQRRAFARGIIESIGVAHHRQWMVDCKGSRRAQGVRRMMRSVGVPARVSQAPQAHMLHVPQWLASIPLDLGTEYPNDKELTSEAAPMEAVAELTSKMEVLKKQREAHRGIYNSVERLLEKGEPLHPGLLRAAWHRVLAKPTSPIYDTARVMSVTLKREADVAYRVSAEGELRQYEADGYVFRS
jgi:hypothetical protein